MEATLRDVLNIVTPLFAIATMLSMGLGLRLREVLQPLKDARLVAVVLFANFVIVPLAALLIAELLALDEDLRIGLLLISVAAGAPLVPKLAQIARGNVPAAVSLVALLIVATIVYMPIVLPILLPDADVDAFGIATTLILQLLLPLALGLAVMAFWQEIAQTLQPKIALAGNVLLAAMLVLTLGLNLGDVLGLFGSGAIASVLLLIAVAILAGYGLAGAKPGRRPVLALATGQRNLAAAFVVGLGSFADRHEVLALLASAGLIGMVTMIPLAFGFGRLANGTDDAIEADTGAQSDAPEKTEHTVATERRPGDGPPKDDAPATIVRDL